MKSIPPDRTSVLSPDGSATEGSPYTPTRQFAYVAVGEGRRVSRQHRRYHSSASPDRWGATRLCITWS